MKMQMHDLSYETPDYGAPMAADSDSDRPTKKVFPELHLRDAPKLPEGEFWFVARGKKVGYRDPIDEGAEKSCDIAVIEMCPIDAAKAKAMHGEIEEKETDEAKAPRRSFRESVEMAKSEKSEY